MHFSDLFTSLHEHHINTLVIYHGATLDDTDICCSPVFKQHSKVIITVYNAKPILIRNRGTDLSRCNDTLTESEFKSFLMDPIDGAVESQSWILSHSGTCQHPAFLPLIRKVYEYRGGNDENIRRVPVTEYRKTLMDHGNAIDI
jgi:hypothetical protein